VKENPKNSKDGQAGSGSLPWKQIAMLAAVLAVLQACLTINGRGIEGFVLWILIFFVGYWLLFTFLVWLVRYLRRRS
jgi:hypothetical protein